MPRTEETNQRIREEQTQKIILAATRVFARKGLTATKMTDIAREAGMSYGLLYHYFTNKELIFRASVERAVQGYQKLFKNILEQPVSPWERIYQLTDIILNGIQQEPESSLVTQQAIINESIPQEIKEMALRDSLGGIALFEQVLREGQAAGQVVEGEVTELAALYFACIGGIALDFVYFDFPRSSFPKTASVLRLLKA